MFVFVDNIQVENGSISLGDLVDDVEVLAQLDDLFAFLGYDYSMANQLEAVSCLQKELQGKHQKIHQRRM